jgi:hypothetical protein
MLARGVLGCTMPFADTDINRDRWDYFLKLAQVDRRRSRPKGGSGSISSATAKSIRRHRVLPQDGSNPDNQPTIRSWGHAEKEVAEDADHRQCEHDGDPDDSR